MTREPIDILSELLVLNAQSGDEDAIGELVELWTPKLNARAHRLTLDDDAALDIVQESWVGIAKGLRRLRDPARFGAWALRIVSHKSADWIKARSRERTLDAQLRKHRPESDFETDHAQSIRAAIGRLEPKLREVVYLFYMDNCTLEQAAYVLDIPIGTAKTRLKRARDRLRPVLENLLEQPTI